jgi:hypothetical protein
VSTKQQRAYRRELTSTTLHRVDGYGGTSWCGKPWHALLGATVASRFISCRACEREWCWLHGGVKRSAGGMWKVDGRRYRSRRLALLSTLEAR